MGIRVIESNMINFNMLYVNDVINNKESIKKKLEIYNGNKDLINNGTYHKIRNFSRTNEVECWQVVSKDKSEALLYFSRKPLHGLSNIKRIKLKGLNEDAVYRNREINEVFSGGALMHYGVNLNKLYGDYSSDIIHLKML